MTDTNTAADIDRRLNDLAERVRRVASGVPDAHVDNILAEEAADWTEPWRYDLQTERLHIVLEEGSRLVEEMQSLQYARLPQEVRDADAARHAASRERRRADNAAWYCPDKHRQRLIDLDYPADVIEQVVEACATV